MTSHPMITKTLSEHWSHQHLTIFYRSQVLAIILFITFLVAANPPEMTLGRKYLVYGGAYLAFFILGELMHYLFFYLPNYLFYKRMIKDGKEDEIIRMIDEYGMSKLIYSKWFIHKEGSSLGKRSKD